MKDLWHLHLIDILDIVFRILVFYLDNQMDLGISVNGFFPFHLVDASLTFFRFHFCCVDNISLCMSSGRTWVLSLVRSCRKTYKHNNGYRSENCHKHSKIYEIAIKFIILWYLKRTLDRNEDIACLNALNIHKMLTLEWNGWTMHFIIYTYKQK
jgi:hypothetical protein